MNRSDVTKDLERPIAQLGVVSQLKKTSLPYLPFPVFE
jgi:hypothetical protein